MKRPDVRVNLTWLDWVMEAVAILILLAMIGLIVMQYTSLPSIIPTHFNASGEVDGYGGKWTVLLLAVVAVVVYVLATLASRYPNLMNYPIPITEENHERQFLNAVKMIRVLKCLSVILFFFLIYGAHEAEVLGIVCGPEVVLEPGAESWCSVPNDAVQVVSNWMSGPVLGHDRDGLLDLFQVDVMDLVGCG